MKFLIISHADHYKADGKLLSYAPYVREMNIWLKHVDSLEIVAPLKSSVYRSINLPYQNKNIRFNEVPALDFTTLKRLLISTIYLPIIIFKLILACKKADHIHLRCPGNIGLLGCFVQVLFPGKMKTAKYAGNWDPKSKQPLSYRLQKKILSNTFWTKNMTVLVYGQWLNQTKNIKPFFTATFNDSEKIEILPRSYSEVLKFIFIGTLSPGKRPLLAIKIVEALINFGKQVSLDIYGDGVMMDDISKYISNHNLKNCVRLHGNQSQDVIKAALKVSHFTILPSKSEGWPKALAEGMFFGVIPISTKISCIPWMLDNGQRGILIDPELKVATETIMANLENRDLYEMSKLAQLWSQNYTLDKFEKDISKLLSI